MTYEDLKDVDKDRMRDINARNRYGLDSIMMKNIIANHQKAKKAGDEYACALIEYRLTDINFHHEVSMLNTGRYNELKKEVNQW